MSVSVHEVEPVCKSCAQLYSQTIIPVRKKWRYTQADDSVIDEGVSDEWYSSKECTREECRYRQGAQCQLQNSVRCPTFQFQCRSVPITRTCQSAYVLMICAIRSALGFGWPSPTVVEMASSQVSLFIVRDCLTVPNIGVHCYCGFLSCQCGQRTTRQLERTGIDQ